MKVLRQEESVQMRLAALDYLVDQLQPEELLKVSFGSFAPERTRRFARGRPLGAEQEATQGPLVFSGSWRHLFRSADRDGAPRNRFALSSSARSNQRCNRTESNDEKNASVPDGTFMAACPLLRGRSGGPSNPLARSEANPYA